MTMQFCRLQQAHHHTSNGVQLLPILPTASGLRKNGIRRTLTGDATMASTILDRLMHRAAMLEFEGKSYRLKEAASRIALNPVATP